MIVTVFKSAMPVAILLLAFFFKLQKPSLPLSLIILVIVSGTAIAVVHDVKYLSLETYPVVIMTLSVLAGGLRWTLTALLLTKRGTNAMATMMLLAPPMGLSMAVVSLLFGEYQYYSSLFDRHLVLFLLFVGGSNYLQFQTSYKKEIHDNSINVCICCGISFE